MLLWFLGSVSIAQTLDVFAILLVLNGPFGHPGVVDIRLPLPVNLSSSISFTY